MPRPPKLRRFLICGDVHGDMQHTPAVEALLDFAEDYRPDVVVHLGDNWDFRNLRQKATEKERSERMLPDFEAGMDFLGRLFQYGEERHFLRGNHDERLWVARESLVATVAEYADTLIGRIERKCRQLGVKMLPYDSRDGVLHVGHLQVIHGYHHGISACAQHARIYGNVVFGHIHSIESYQVPGLEMREARAIGCLCDKNPDYMATKTAKLRWAHGWAYGVIFPDQTYSIFQVREIEGTYYAAPEIKNYGR